VALFRQGKFREIKLARQQSAKLENMFENMGQDEKKTLNIVIKADVRGSLEALQGSLSELGNDEVQVKIVSGGVGGITETDANLALASNAVVFGFNVRADAAARKIIETEGLDLRYYSVIYEIIDDVKKALSGMLGSDVREQILGVAEVRDVFRSPKFWRGGRLYGHRGNCAPQPPDSRTARRRCYLRRRAGIPAPLQGRRWRSP
jgi:translation initiation factor IF-2